MRNRIIDFVGIALVALAALPARAERHPEHMLTLGFQTEYADIVALARPGPTTVNDDAGTLTTGFQIEQAIRGDAAPGARLDVVHRSLGHGQIWKDNTLYLVFLRAVPDAGDGHYESLSGAFGFRPVVDGTPSARFPGIVAQIATTLGDASSDRPTVADPDALRALLARLATDADDGIAASAALDLVRHEELLPGLGDAERLALVTSFRARTPGRARRQIALAAAAGKHIEAANALVSGLLEPKARLDRGGLADALYRLGDARSEDLLLARLAAADQAQKGNLLVALGKLGAARSVARVTALLAAPEPAVRVEAAHALGNVARNVHRATPGEVVSGRAELIALLDAAEKRAGDAAKTGSSAPPDTRNQIRAALWALAQLDDPQAFSALREIAASVARSAAVRDYATHILARPRVMLILD